MKRFLYSVFIFIFIGNWLLVIIGNYSHAHAIYDPLSAPNNRIGVHILDTQELADAAKLVNSTGGDWGYVTIPMQSNDRDVVKWTAFFKRCSELHLIPIVRLATYVDGDKWVTPTAYDLVDFANFLTEMPWPTENRYIVLFNEPNHSNEWGGFVNPAEYAALLVQANSIFKSRSQEFYLMPAGLDMSAPQNHTSFDALEYYRRMSKAVPTWGDAVDGFSFHTYPNPGFTASYTSKTRYGPQSYRHELVALKKLGITPKHLFITETGTLNTSGFYSNVISTVWTEPNIVAITPFLLFAGTGNFTGFSLLTTNHQPTKNYQELYSIPKQVGSPLLNIEVLAGFTHMPKLPVAPTNTSPSTLTTLISSIKSLLFRPAPTLTIGNNLLTVEIADNPTSWSRGLSYRDTLPVDEGMLFVFPDTISRVFWMNEMKFSLDMIWIRAGKVVEISANIPPPAQTNGIPQQVFAKEKSDWILEVPGGYAQAKNITVGDAVDINR